MFFIKLKKYDDESKWKALLRLTLKYTEVKIPTDVDLNFLKSEHRQIFDEFKDEDKVTLAKVVEDTSEFLKADLDTYINNLNQKISA
mgnify:CR=1 FL=1